MATVYRILHFVSCISCFMDEIRCPIFSHFAYTYWLFFGFKFCYNGEKPMADAPLPSTSLVEASSRPTFGQIAGRLGGPVLLFSSVLAGTLGVSRFALLPTLTAVEIDGSVRDTEDLSTYGVELRQKISDLEAHRNVSVMPLQGTSYRMLTDRKAGHASVVELLDHFRSIAEGVSPELPHAIAFTSWTVDTDTAHIVLSGHVSGVGPASMTVLAAFTDALRADSRIASIIPPTFSRFDDAVRGLHSPFTISLTMQ